MLEEAKPGDEVVEPVKNGRGMVILPKGAKLSPALIERMRKMGVRELLVEGNDPNAPPPKTFEDLMAELEVRFEGLEENSLMMEMKKIAKEHLLNRESR
ncbi:MAG: hypothetical protein O2954_13895 [bacterium]|nr:hypothetical protein [bacterium]